MASTAPETPIPIVLCGKTEAIARGVIAGLEPEYEREYFAFSLRLSFISTRLYITVLLLSIPLLSIPIPIPISIPIPSYFPTNAHSPVIHLIPTPSAGTTQLPALLSGRTPPATSDSTALGTHNSSRRPRAVVLGGGYDDAMVAEMMNAVRAEHVRAEHSPLAPPDLAIPAPPLAPEYGREMVSRVKRLLGGLGLEGKDRDGEKDRERDRETEEERGKEMGEGGEKGERDGGGGRG
jgi:hypothetical protein